MQWVETQLSEYRDTYNKIFDTIIKTYLSNGAQADVSSFVLFLVFELELTALALASKKQVITL